jgi:FkbM family methyltransferase
MLVLRSAMTFTSYAQNFEDVILRRALRGVERGFYIDIGAQDPVLHSVSLAFYELGWRGVHVEPISAYAAALRSARPDEEVIEVAISAQDGTMPFFEIDNTGLSTGDQAIADRHASAGMTVNRVRARSTPLARILDRYADRDIHWLKIDVEGMELAVIESWPPSPVRPWIVLVESTEPLTQKPSYTGWEPRLLALGYEFVYFDGLNRFYVSLEHPELKSCFGPGPNIFDGFGLSSAWASNTMIQLAARNHASAWRIRALEHELASVHRSFAWRISAPIRVIERAMRWLVGSIAPRILGRRGRGPLHRS